MTKPVFNTLYEIPESIRILQGARLTFEQAVELIEHAYELGAEDAPDLGRAKESFFDNHEIEGDIWISKKKSE